MNIKEKNEITKIYKLLRGKKNIHLEDSIFLKTILKPVKTDLKRYMKEASISVTEIESDIRKSLFNKGYIQRNPDHYHKVCLTAKGLWYYELDRKKVDLDTVLKKINEEHLFDSQVRTLNDQEKVLIASLFFCRFFSSDCDLILDGDEDILSSRNKGWKAICVETRKILKTIGVIGNNPLAFEAKVDPTYLMRRQNKLPDKIYHLYVRDSSKGNGRTHYLNLSLDSNKNINEKDVKRIFDLVFKDNVDGAENLIKLRDAIGSFAFKNRYRASAHKFFLSPKMTSDLTKVFDSQYL